MSGEIVTTVGGSLSEEFSLTSDLDSVRSMNVHVSVGFFKVGNRHGNLRSDAKIPNLLEPEFLLRGEACLFIC